MKVIRLTTLLDFGGQEKQYISFTNQKELLRHEYVFAAIGHGGFAEKNIATKGFRVKIFGQNPAISNLKNIWVLYKWFRKEKPDIVHTAAAEANFHGVIAAKLAGVKIIFAEEIGFPSHSSIAKKVFRQLYRLVNKVIGVSQSVVNFLVEIKEILPEKGIVIYNPVSAPKKYKKEKAQDFTIISVGRLEIVKNQQLLIEAFSKLDNISTQLILVGDGRERENLEALVIKLQLQDRVTITGFVSEPEKFLSKADLFVLPSLTEGFGIAAVEAMQMGIPCLCCNVGGIPEFITNDKTGWLFNPESLQELIIKLNLILKLNEDNLKEIGNEGQQSIGNKFSEENYIETLEQFYSSK